MHILAIILGLLLLPLALGWLLMRYCLKRDRAKLAEHANQAAPPGKGEA